MPADPRIVTAEEAMRLLRTADPPCDCGVAVMGLHAQTCARRSPVPISQEDAIALARTIVELAARMPAPTDSGKVFGVGVVGFLLGVAFSGLPPRRPWTPGEQKWDCKPFPIVDLFEGGDDLEAALVHATFLLERGLTPEDVVQFITEPPEVSKTGAMRWLAWIGGRWIGTIERPAWETGEGRWWTVTSAYPIPPDGEPDAVVSSRRRAVEYLVQFMPVVELPE